MFDLIGCKTNCVKLRKSSVNPDDCTLLSFWVEILFRQPRFLLGELNFGNDVDDDKCVVDNPQLQNLWHFRQWDVEEHATLWTQKCRLKISSEQHC